MDTTENADIYSLGTDVSTQIKYTMYLGTNDKNTLKQEIPTETIKAQMQETCFKYVDGYTVWEVEGFFRDDDGNVTSENFLVYVFIDTPIDAVKSIMDEALIKFNQGSILLEDNAGHSTFYSNDTSNSYINDGVTVYLYGTDSYTIGLSSGLFGTAVNINATYSSGENFLVGNSAENIILAGSNSSTLWGGQDFANDILVGGSNYDMFLCGKSEGSDVVLNASSADIVYLHDAVLSDIVATAYDGTNVALQFNTGNVLSVACTDYVSSNFVLSDGSSYRFNRTTASWQ